MCRAHTFLHMQILCPSHGRTCNMVTHGLVGIQSCSLATSRISEPVWYWQDPDHTFRDKLEPDPQFLFKNDPDPSSKNIHPLHSVMKIFHLFYDDFHLNCQIFFLTISFKSSFCQYVDFLHTALSVGTGCGSGSGYWSTDSQKKFKNRICISDPGKNTWSHLSRWEYK